MRFESEDAAFEFYKKFFYDVSHKRELPIDKGANPTGENFDRMWNVGMSSVGL